MKNLNFVGFPNYAITRQGEVFNLITSNKLKPCLHGLKRSQYKAVRLYYKGENKVFKLHRLLAEAFIPNPDNLPQVNHKDGDKLNNKLSNLEWVTASGNTEHAYRNNLHSWNVIDEEKAHVVCDMLQQGFKTKEVADCLGLEYYTVYDILTEKTYLYVSCEYDLKSVPRREKLDASKVVTICELLEKKLPIKEIAEKCNVKSHSIYAIKNGNRHINISKNYKW